MSGLDEIKSRMDKVSLLNCLFLSLECVIYNLKTFFLFFIRTIVCLSLFIYFSVMFFQVLTGHYENNKIVKYFQFLVILNHFNIGTRVC